MFRSALSVARIPAALPVLAFLLGLAGCAPFPAQVRDAPELTGPPPALVPVEGILQQADGLDRGASAIAPVNARASALRAKAARLRSM